MAANPAILPCETVTGLVFYFGYLEINNTIMETKNENNQDKNKTDEQRLDLDSDVNTTGFPRPEGESQTVQEDPDTDPNQTDKPGFKRSNV